MRDRNKDEERLTSIVCDAVWEGDFEKFDKELAAMRAIAIHISESSSGNDAAKLLAAMVADLTYIVAISVRCNSTKPDDYDGDEE